MLCLLKSRSWFKIFSAALVGLLLVAALPARAGMIVFVQDVTANAGTSGNTLEVDLQNTGSAAVDIASFSFELTVNPSSGVSFTGADINTTLYPYIFAGTSIFGPTIGVSTGATLDAGDIGVPPASIGAGSILGLGRVSFDVAGSAQPGPVTVTVTPYPITSLTAPDSSNIPIDTYNNGTITITSPGVVPEPSALVSATLGFLGAAWMIRAIRAKSR